MLLNVRKELVFAYHINNVYFTMICKKSAGHCMGALEMCSLLFNDMVALMMPLINVTSRIGSTLERQRCVFCSRWC